ncbi:DUF2079 domain-containing protein [Halococcus salifodinae]|uniref:DUF2079 domain-containing protein n=1 Tax=Halococcus salifodinae DSM 8989 TaxID=1227456 RepID=M0N1P2_9EURY|nr:DUF2079 domain-containing protein [Halococcus salifodinae]EMA51887.1 hypothetical protein C450_12018 [Halococcus salifodinae DSM 8989]
MDNRLTRIGSRLVPDAIATPIARSFRRYVRVPWYILALAAILFVGFAAYTTALYESFWLTGADFGTYVHMFATTLDGTGFLQQGKYVAGHPGGSYWGGHFTLTLLVFLPLFALVESPVTLLLWKSFFLAASIPLVWIVASDHVADRRVAGFLAASYALNPFLWSAWIYDFQEHVLLPVLVLLAYHWYYTERYRRFLLAFALVLVTNELMVLIGGGFLVGLALGAYRAGRLSRERWVFAGAAVLTVGAKLLSGAVIDRFSRVSGIREAAIAAPLQPFVEGGRATTGELVLLVLSRPELIVDLLGTDLFTKLLYFALFLAPVLFLAVVDESTLGALAPFVGFAWLLSGTEAFYTFGGHYPLYLLPFVYIGASRVLGRLSPSLPSGRVLTMFFVVVLLTSAGAGAQTVAEEGAVPETGEHTETLTAAIETVPANASLVTQNTIYPHVATRSNATFIPNPSLFGLYQEQYGTPRPEYVLFDTRLETRSFDWSSPVRDAYFPLVGDEYGVSRYQDGIWILKRGYNGSPTGITQSGSGERIVFEADEFVATGGQFKDGRLVDRGGTNDSNVWHGPYTALPAGNYTATFHVAARGGGANGSTAAVDVTVGEEHRTIARQAVPSGNATQTVTVPFTLDEPRNGIEFRGFRTGPGTISLESVVVQSGTNGTTADRRGAVRAG